MTALNISTGKKIWQVPLGYYKKLKEKGKITGTENFGGTTVTRGGITITSGTLDRKIYFHNSKNGDLLKSINIPYIGSAPPSTYIVNNEQYIVLHATGGMSLKNGYGDIVKTGDALIGFKLKN